MDKDLVRRTRETMGDDLKEDYIKWRTMKSTNVKKEDIKVVVKKATSNELYPPKKKHESTLAYWAIVGHRSYDELRNYNIIKQLIKRSRNDNDTVSLKSLIVLHSLVTNPQTKTMRYLGTYFLNFCLDSGFNHMGRSMVILKFAQYIDLLGRCFLECRYIDIISPDKEKLKTLNLDANLKYVSSLEKILEEMVNFDLPSMYCCNVVVREAHRAIGFKMIFFMNNYTDAVVSVIKKIDYENADEKMIQMVNYYFIISSKVKTQYEYFIKYVFNDTTTVSDINEISLQQREEMEKIRQRFDSKLSTQSTSKNSSNTQASTASASSSTTTLSTRKVSLAKIQIPQAKSKITEESLIDLELSNLSVSEQHWLKGFLNRWFQFCQLKLKNSDGLISYRISNVSLQDWIPLFTNTPIDVVW